MFPVFPQCPACVRAARCWPSWAPRGLARQHSSTSSPTGRRGSAHGDVWRCLATLYTECFFFGLVWVFLSFSATERREIRERLILGISSHVPHIVLYCYQGHVSQDCFYCVCQLSCYTALPPAGHESWKSRVTFTSTDGRWTCGPSRECQPTCSRRIFSRASSPSRNSCTST